MVAQAEGADGSVIVDEEAVKRELYTQVARSEVCLVVCFFLYRFTGIANAWYSNRATVLGTMFLRRFGS